MKRITSFFCVIFLNLTLQAAPNDSARYASDEVIVRLKSAASLNGVRGRLRAQAAASFTARAGARVSSHPTYIQAMSELDRTYVLKLQPGEDVESKLAELRKDPDIESAGPNYRYRVFRTPDDSLYGDLWGLRNTGQSSGSAGADMDAEIAWDTVTGSASVVVAVIDTGIDTTHPDLAANIGTGYDFGDGDSNPHDDCTDPTVRGHGSHVSGIISAVGNNATGVTGVGWGLSIMPLKVAQSDCDLFLDDVASALVYATNNGAHVVNISLGGEHEATMQAAVNAATSAGLVVVAAAGNESTDDFTFSYPAAYSDVVAVAATDRTDQVASFSNYGSWVDIAAPGDEIRSTIPSNTYGYKSGTSMASPMVAGVVGLMKSLNPAMTRAQILTKLAQATEDIDALNPTYVGLIGAGRINAAYALMSVNAIAPAAGIIDTNATVSLTGVGLLTPMDIRLTRSGQSPIIATGHTVNATRTSLTFSFDLTGAAQGNWTLVASTGNLVYTFTNAFSVESVILNSVSPSSGTSTSSSTTLTMGGVNFGSGMMFELQQDGQTDIAGTNVVIMSSLSAVANFDLSGVHGGLWDVVAITSSNASYVFEDSFLITGPDYQVASVAPNQSYTFNLTGPQGAQVIQWPSCNLGQTFQLDIDARPLSSALAVNSAVDPYAATGVGIEITPTPSTLTLCEPFALTLSYPSTGVDEDALTIATYNPSTGRWEPLDSTIDATANTITAQVPHLSLFAVVQHGPQVNLSKAIAFPNPFRANLGHDQIVFDFLTAGARVRLYDVSGGLIQDFLDDNNDGQIIWDVTNQSGQKIASGIYIYLITDPAGNKETGKIGVIR